MAEQLWLTEMFHAIMLVETEPGKENTVVRRISQLGEVNACHIVTGVFDLVIEILTQEREKLKETVEEIRKTSGIRSTQTLIVIHSERKEKGR